MLLNSLFLRGLLGSRRARPLIKVEILNGLQALSVLSPHQTTYKSRDFEWFISVRGLCGQQAS
jgi:hypothetical protein